MGLEMKVKRAVLKELAKRYQRATKWEKGLHAESRCKGILKAEKSWPEQITGKNSCGLKSRVYSEPKLRFEPNRKSRLGRA